MPPKPMKPAPPRQPMEGLMRDLARQPMPKPMATPHRGSNLGRYLHKPKASKNG